MFNTLEQIQYKVSPELSEGGESPYDGIFRLISEELMEWGAYLSKCEELLQFLENSEQSLLNLSERFPTFSNAPQLSVIVGRKAIVRMHLKIADREVTHLNYLLLDLDLLMEAES